MGLQLPWPWYQHNAVCALLAGQILHQSPVRAVPARGAGREWEEELCTVWGCWLLEDDIGGHLPRDTHISEHSRSRGLWKGREDLCCWLQRGIPFLRAEVSSLPKPAPDQANLSQLEGKDVKKLRGHF